MIEKLPLARMTKLGISLAITTLFMAGVVLRHSIIVSRQSDERVVHTHEVLENVDSLLSAIQDVEISYRTFGLMGDGQFVDSYRFGVLRTSEEEKTIRELTADNPNQRRRLIALIGLTERYIQFGDMVIRVRQTRGPEAAVEQIRLAWGIKIMQEIRRVIHDIENEEHQLLLQRDAEAKLRARQLKVVFVVGSFLALLLAFGAGWTILQLISRVQTRESLQDSEEKYRMLVDGIHDYAIFMLDPQGQVVSWNAGAERVKGYTAEEIIGHNFSCFFPPEDMKQGRPQELLRLTALSGRQEEQGVRVRKDGSRFLANITFTALRDRAANLKGFAEFSHDLSETKESGAKYRGLLEAAPDAMVVVNQEGEIVLLNVQAEKQFGYRGDELLGQKVKNIIPRGFAGRLIADGTRSAAEALAQQIGTGIELNGRRKDGTEFPIEIMLSPLESAEGILVTAAIRDISVRKRSEEHLVKTVGELKRSNDELEQFAYVASHDLQEPLRMVASYTQLLAKRYKGRLDSDADEFIAYAVDGSNRMQGLIKDLLAYSRAGAAGKTLHEIPSESALKEALTNLRATIGESGAVVTHDVLPAITMDETQLAQVFQNLVGNAIKYRSAEVPRVHVSAMKNGGNEWIFSVRDNGLGIDPQYFERIFILFQRLHGRTEFNGTGIGLAICKKILERAGGRIWVESQPEKGSTFFFALPESGE